MSTRTHSPRTLRRHVHWFRWAGDDPLGTAGLYTCRCGQRRPGL